VEIAKVGEDEQAETADVVDEGEMVVVTKSVAPVRR
jgi:hypothetical protein